MTLPLRKRTPRGYIWCGEEMETLLLFSIDCLSSVVSCCELFTLKSRQFYVVFNLMFRLCSRFVVPVLKDFCIVNLYNIQLKPIKLNS